MRAIIVSGGNKPSKELLMSYIKDDDYIIGVDKGCNALYEYGITPNEILGDFDSADLKIIDYFKNKKVKNQTFPPEKDYTDSDLGYIVAKERGFKDIIFFGATGTRVDHMLANIGIMIKANRENIHMEIVDDNNRMFIINKKTTLKGKYGQLLGFHALSDVVKNVSIKGAKYTLENYDMTLLEPRAICNEFLDEDVTISFDDGLILVIYSND